jgi:hypothetical protein
MITFLVKLTILLLLVCMIKRVYEMIQYNSNAVIVPIDYPTKDRLQTELKHKNPLLMTIQSVQPVTIHDFNLRTPGYMIQENDSLLSLDQVSKSDSYSIHKNKSMIQDFHLTGQCSPTMDMLTNIMSCDKSISLSLYKGTHPSTLYKNYRELLAIQCLSGTIDIYLYNPKHELDIKGKQLQTIKKWGMKQTLSNQQVLLIPTEWYYSIETKEESVATLYEADTISTWLFNYLRRK